MPRAAGIAFEPRAEGVETMGLDVIGILSILVAILGVGVPMGGLALRGIGNLKKDLTQRTDRLSGQIESVQKELRDELKGEIAGVKGEIVGLRDELKGDIADLRGELKGDIAGLRDRIDAVHSEMVEVRMALSDRVARLEGTVFGVPLPDTGTDPA
ncbi:hypothetical protein [Candidatus Palauibacter sp.]|uniref:hypothetical protein n=1 Tax=Candidatus Palauibacter sp. TaxID=3101350 RepID=UPI003D140EB1